MTVGLTVVYALVMSLSFGRFSDLEDFLFWEGLFAAPLIVASFLSIWLGRLKARTILLGFVVGYSILTAMTFYTTFGFEHDAQYQLMLLLVPLLGFPSLVIASVAAAISR